MSKLETKGMRAGLFAWHAAVCREKRRFRSYKFAKSFAQRAGKRIGSRLKPYECACCGQYHLKTVESADE